MTRQEIIDRLTMPAIDEGRNVWFLTGEAGMGKTTLLQQVTQRADPAWSVASVECSSPVAGLDVGAIEALHPWVSLIHTLSADAASSDSAKLAADLALTWIKFVPIVGDLIESTVNTVGIVQRYRSKPAEPAVSREHVMEQCLAFFRAASQRMQLLLIIDDAHWADDSSVNMLFALAREQFKGIRIVVAFRERDAQTAVRGEEHAILRIKRELERYALCETIAVPPLDEVGARAILDSSYSDQDVRQALTFSGGNPLLLLGWSRGELRSGTVHAVVREQIGRLDREVRDILRYAAAEGEQFCSSTIQRLAERSALYVAGILRRAQEEYGLITSVGKQPYYATETNVYAFVSDAVRLALESELIAEESELVHAALADILRSELQVARDAGLATSYIRVRLAAHELAASMHDAAARTLLDHAHELWSLFAVVELQDVLDRVDAVIAAVRPGDAHQALLAESLDLRAEVALFEGRLQDVDQLNEQAYTIHMDRGEKQRACEVLFRMGAVENHRGSPSAVHDLSDRIAALADECDYEDGRRAAISMKGLWLESEGRYDESKACYEDLLRKTQGERTRQRAAALVNLSRLAVHRAQYEETLAPLAEATEILHELKRWDGMARALNNTGISLVNLGRIEEARSVYEQALELNEQIGDAIGASSLRTNLGQLHLELGDVNAALQLFEMSVDTKRRLNDRYGLSIALYSRAIARKQVGDHAACAADLQESLEIATAINEHSVIAEVQRLMNESSS